VSPATTAIARSVALVAARSVLSWAGPGAPASVPAGRGRAAGLARDDEADERGDEARAGHGPEPRAPVEGAGGEVGRGHTEHGAERGAGEHDRDGAREVLLGDDGGGVRVDRRPDEAADGAADEPPGERGGPGGGERGGDGGEREDHERRGGDGAPVPAGREPDEREARHDDRRRPQGHEQAYLERTARTAEAAGAARARGA